LGTGTNLTGNGVNQALVDFQRIEWVAFDPAALGTASMAARVW
jgi:hypothetical protein